MGSTHFHEKYSNGPAIIYNLTYFKIFIKIMSKEMVSRSLVDKFDHEEGGCKRKCPKVESDTCKFDMHAADNVFCPSVKLNHLKSRFHCLSMIPVLQY